ncbi:beta-ketoacyl synthase N-terminal-like domain-containing protein [Nocardia wallacei]|uniref:beta-ketoacyl synthase N-terminal-like domain-containing protein n=1 Tax=Nocardia wallacei TaxID=480035 RepID=UPI0024542846|nr:beta-ketoacyl synthase N-terminal-like domain-containing protein [Nocardia wallacei]
MTTTFAPDDPVVTGIGVVSPPGSVAGTPWFDYRTELGRRGYKYFPPACHYLLAAARRAVADAGGPPGCAPSLRSAAVGTNSAGSVWHSEMDRTIVGAGAHELSPMTATFFSINLVAGQLAIEHELTAFTLTFTSPHVAGVEALHLGALSLTPERAQWMLVGATEGPVDEDEPGAARSEEGSVVLVVEPAGLAAARGAGWYGRCASVSGFLPPDEADSDRAGELLGRLGVRDAAVPVGAVVDDSRVGRAVRRALGPQTTVVAARSGCLEPMVQVAAGLTDGPPVSLCVAASSAGNIVVTRIERTLPVY